MALFKALSGDRTNLPEEKHDGYVYFCEDDGSFHFDYKDAAGILQRKQINAKDAETLCGMTLDEIKTHVAVQSDWLQSDEAAADYIKNKPAFGTLSAKNEVAKTDLAEDIQTSLVKADTAIQSCLGIILNNSKYVEIDTNAKTFKIPIYSRIVYGDKVYPIPEATIIDLSNPVQGYITYDIETGAFETNAHTDLVIENTKIVLATYGSSGAIINMPGSYTIDGNLFGINTDTSSEIADNSIAGSKLMNGAVTMAKRTVSGSFAVLWNSYAYPEFNTTAKTFYIPGYSRILLGTKTFTQGMTNGAGVTLDISGIQHGFICYDTAAGAFTAYPYTQETGVPESSVLFATYAEYGKFVHMACSYKIDGNLFGIDTDTETVISDNSVTTAKLADGAATTAKSTVAGRNAIIFNMNQYSNFNTDKKTLTIPQYSRIMCGKSVYFNTGTTASGGATIDLSNAQHGYITFNPTTQEWKAYAYTVTSITENELLMFVYSNYGEIVSSQSVYTVNGKLFGIDTDKELEIPNGHITQDMLAPKLLQNQLSRCPRYTFTDLSAMGIDAWSDISIIDGNLWLFYPSSDEDHIQTNGTIKIVNKETLETIKTITHNFGHVNTCDYCKETDCLIVGNLPGNTAYPAALYIFYNVSAWANVDTLDFATVDKTIVDMRVAFPTATAAACSWGESNFAYNNIAYVSFGYDRQFTKIVLGMGTNQLTNGTYAAADADKFNGTYNILLTSDFEPMGSGDDVIQGATFYNGRMLTANGDEWTARASIWGFNINGNIQRELLEFPIYNANGQKNSQYKTYTEGIAVDEETGYVYQGIFSGQLYAIRFYLIKYKL